MRLDEARQHQRGRGVEDRVMPPRVDAAHRLDAAVPDEDVALDPEAERAVADNFKKRGVMKEEENETPGE